MESTKVSPTAFLYRYLHLWNHPAARSCLETTLATVGMSLMVTCIPQELGTGGSASNVEVD